VPVPTARGDLPAQEERSKERVVVIYFLCEQIASARGTVLAMTKCQTTPKVIPSAKLQTSNL